MAPINKKECILHVIMLQVLLLGVLPGCAEKCRKTRLAVVHGRMLGIKGGLVQYQQKYGHLPPAYNTDKNDKPLHSWRLLILADEHPYRNIDTTKPWDDPNHEGRVPLPIEYNIYGEKNSGLTRILAITGPGTAFEKNKVVSRDKLPNDLVLVIGVRNTTIQWMEPRDLNVERPEEIRRSLPSDDFGTIVLFADLHIWVLRKNTPAVVLEKFFTIKGAKAHDRMKILGPYLKFGPTEDMQSAKKARAKKK